MKKILLCTCLLALSLGANAQDNHGYGIDDSRFKSLAEEVAHLKKSNDMFNVYINYAANAQVVSDADHQWSTGFTNKHLRLEIKGNLTNHHNIGCLSKIILTSRLCCIVQTMTQTIVKLIG